MKLKKRLILSISIIICLVIVIFIIIISGKKDKYNNLKDSLSNTFFYLDKSYNNLNDISDFCKISLVYDTNYLKSDYTVSDAGNKIKGYTISNALSSIKKILGDNITIDFDNLIKDDCIYNNKAINLTYNTKDKVLYSSGLYKSNRTIVVDWFYEKEDGNTLELKSHALMIVKNDKYDLYVDKNMENLIASYNTLKEAKQAARDNMFKSYEYVFKFNKENNNYIWKSFEINKFDDILVD